MRKIKIGGGPWKNGSPSSKPKEPIKIHALKWNSLPEQEKKSDAAQMSEPVKIHVLKWNSLPEQEKKSDAAQMSEPVKIQPAEWGELSGLQEPNVIRQFEGINGLNSFAIKDSHATRNKNITTSRYPALAVRNGGAVVSSTITTEIQGIGVRGSELHVVANGIWSKYVSGTWTQLKTGLSSTRKYSFVNFQGNFTTNSLLVSNGIDAAIKYDGTSVTALAGAPAQSSFITTHDNRVYLAVKSTVYFSALRKAEDWTTVNDSGSIVVETTDGKDITGLVAGSSRLTVFKANSIHELFGNNPDNYQMKIVTDNLGSPTGHTAQVIDGTIYFLGNDGVYRYSGGSLPSSDFSMQIKDQIARINPSYADQSVSWVVGKKYYLGIPLDSASSPNAFFEYDIEFNTWNVWNFPTRVTAKGAVLNLVTYIGTDTGVIYKLDNTQTTDNGTAIAWEWVSKPFTFSSIAAKSRWYRMWVVADIPTGATLNVHLSADSVGETWTKVQSITANIAIQSKEILIPTTLVNNSNFVRIRLEGTGQVVVYEVSRQERIFPFGQN